MVDVVHVAIRWLHVLSMAVVLGGAILTWVSLWQIGRTQSTTDQRGERSVLTLAAGYEWLFWAAVGVIVMTGVGNLGTLAPGVPPSASTWGLTLTIKLVGVLGLLLGSVVRTFLVGRFRAASDVTNGQTHLLRRGYAATAVYLTVVVALAEVLAHG